MMHLCTRFFSLLLHWDIFKRVTLMFFFVSPLFLYSATFYTRQTGNWSDPNTWSTVACNGAAASSVPGAGDDVIITCSNNARTVTVDGNYTCRDLTIGTANQNAIIQINTVGNSLTITGVLTFNTANNNRTYRLNAGPGIVNINGTFGGWGTTGTNEIRIGSGTLNVTPAITISNAAQTINITGAGTVNFLNDFTDQQNKLVTSANSTVNFSQNYTVNTTSAVWNTSSTAIFLGSGYSINAAAAITFGNFQIGPVASVSLTGGNISVARNWTNNGGTFNPTTRMITFSGSGVTQIVTKTSGAESFYDVTLNQTTSTLQLGSDIIIANTLNMNGHNININGKILQLGNAGASTLTRTSGTAYGGTFMRWLPTVSISSTVAPLYGLFPVGSSTDYRPIHINSTVNPTGAGYLSVIHVNAQTITDVGYTDNTGDAIQRIADAKTTISSSGGLSGGTYNIDMYMTGFSTTGTLANIKLETLAGSPPGVGANVATIGTVSAPVVRRSGLSLTNLNNDFVVGTMNKTATPLRNVYYSRQSGDWNISSTWSTVACSNTTNGGTYPVAGDIAYICAGHQVDIPNSDQACQALYISGILNFNNNRTLTVNADVEMNGSSSITGSGNNQRLDVLRNFTVAAAANAVIGGLRVTISGTTTIDGNLSFSTSNTGNKIFNGPIIINSTGILDNTVGEDPDIGGNIENNGNWIGCTGGNCRYYYGRNANVGSYTISGTNPVTVSILDIRNSCTVTNLTTLVVNSSNNNNIIGAGTFNNGNGVETAVLYIQNAGTNAPSVSLFNASMPNNFVHYNRAGNQTIRIPDDGAYHTLICASSGTKTLQAGTTTVNNELVVRDNAILDVSNNTLNGPGGLTITNNAEFQIAKCSPTEVPELTGTYSLLGGKITLNGGCNQIYQTSAVGADVVNDITLANSGVKNICSISTINGDLAFSGSATMATCATYFIQACGKSFTYSSTGTTTLGGDISIGSFSQTNGIFDDGGNTITVCGTAWNRTNATANFVPTGRVIFNPSSGSCSVTSSAAANISRFKNVTINTGKTVVADANGINIGNGGSADFTNNGTFTHNNGIVTVIGNATVSGSSTTVFNNLTINAGSTLTGHNTLMQVEGNWTNNGTFTHNNGSVTFQGGTAQTISGNTTFYRLTVNKTAGTTITQSAATISVTNLFTMTEGIYNAGTNILNGAGGYTATGGDLQLSRLATVPELTGTYSITGGTVTLNGAGAQTLRTSATGGSTYYNLIFDKSTAGAGAKTINGLLVINGDVTVLGNATLTNNSSFVQASSKTFTYSSAQTSTFTNSNDVTVGSYNQTNGTLTNGTNSNFIITGSSWNKTGGTFNLAGNGRAIFQGTSGQSFSETAATTFPYVTINNSNHISLSSNMSISTNLTFTVGNIITGSANTVILTTNAATVTRTSGHVDGNFQKRVAAAASTLAFEVGSGSIYSPVSFTFTGATVSSTLTCYADAGDHPDIYASDIDPNKTVNIYWGFTGTPGGSATVTFTYPSSEVDVGADPSIFGSQRYNVPSWTLQTISGTPNSTTTILSGVSSYAGEYIIGERYNPDGVYNAVTGVMAWNDINNWIRYRTGNITCNTGSNIVTGAATAFLSEIAPGNILLLQNSPDGTPIGTVSSVTDNNTIVLTANAGVNATGLSFGIRCIPTLTDEVNIGNINIAGADVSVTLDISTSIHKLIFTSMARSNTLTHSGTNSITITTNAIINQPSAATNTNLWAINGGLANAQGNVQVGSNINSSTRTGRVNITTGTLTIGSNLVFYSQNSGGAIVDLSGATGAADAIRIGSSITYTGAGSNQGTFTVGTSSVVNYNRTAGGQTINLNVNYANLHCNNTSSSGITISSNITSTNITGNLRIQSGLFTYANPNTITGNAGKVFEVSDGATFRMTGTTSFPTGFGTFTFGPTSNTQYWQTTNQTITVISAPGYGNLFCQPTANTRTHTTPAGSTVSIQGDLVIGNGVNTGTTFAGAATTTAVNVLGSVIINSNATLNPANITNISCGKDWTNNGGTFSPTANTVTFNGSGAQQVNGTPVTQTFYNVVVNKAGDALSVAGNTNTLTTNNITITAGTFNAPPTLNLSQTASATLTLNGGTFNAGTLITIRGDWTKNGGTFNHNNGKVEFTLGSNQNINGTAASETFYDVDINKNNGTLTVGGSIATLTIQRHLVQTARSFNASAATTLNIVGNVTWAAQTFTAPANFNLGGSFYYNGGTLVFGTNVTLNGTSAQIIGGTQTYPALINLIINNTFASTAVTLNRPITVNGTLTLTNGHLITDNTNILTMGASGVAGAGSASSFVKGPMIHTKNTTAAENKFFPVGKGTKYKPLELNISHVGAGTNTYSAEIFNGDANTLPYTLPGTLNKVSLERYYDVSKASGPASVSSARLRIYYDTDDFVTDPTNLSVAKDNGAAWVDLGGTATGSPTGNIQSGVFTTFSKFALANKLAGTNPLPIELLYFSATANENKVDIKWETSSEVNNDYFTIEKTINGNEFEAVAKVKGAGNSNNRNIYYSEDNNPYSGNSYYRLKQTDFDGSYTYSSLVPVFFNIEYKPEFIVYPNPVLPGEPINIALQKYKPETQVLVVVFDIEGKELYSKIIITGTDGEAITAIDPHNRLSAGIYFITGSTENDIFSKKLIIK
jgi:hypothetical protein